MQLKELVRTGSLTSLIQEISPNVCSFDEETWKFDYFFYPRESKTLLVFMPSALNPKKRHVPAFHRWSWAEDMPQFDVLSVSDPSLHLHPEILGGWMQGQGGDWVLKRLLRHIATLNSTKKYSNIVFCGSSLGGFVALQAGILSREKDSLLKDVNIYTYVENPQIALRKYWVERHMNLLAQVCYNKKTLAQVDAQYDARLDVTVLAKERGFLSQGIIVVKESDKHHFQVQLAYFQTELEGSGIALPNIEVIPSSLDDSGHTPLTFEQMSARIGVFDLTT